MQTKPIHIIVYIIKTENAHKINVEFTQREQVC